MGDKIVVAILVLLTAFQWGAFGWSTAGGAAALAKPADSAAVLPATVGVLFLLAVFLLGLTLWRVFALKLQPRGPSVAVAVAAPPRTSRDVV